MADATIDVFEADWRKRWLVGRGVEIISEASRHLTDRTDCDGQPLLLIFCTCSRHVIGRREKMRIVGADQHQGRYGDRVEPGDDAIVGLGQHAACGAGQAPRRAMPARANLGALAECGNPCASRSRARCWLARSRRGEPRVAEIRPVSNSINAATSSGWTRWKASDM